MSSLAALIFDVDGTLADTERDGHRVAFNLAFSEAGLDWSWSEALYGELLSVTGGKERIRYFLEHYPSSGAPPTGVDDFIAQLHAAKTRHYTAILRQGAIPLRPGVRRLLDEARKCGLRLAIATTTTLQNVTTLLEYTLGSEAIDWFDVIAAGDVVAAKKPSPAIFLNVLEALGTAPGDCIAFEDSEQGLASALAAGIPTVVMVNDYTDQQRFDGALLVVDHLGEPDRPIAVLAGESYGATCVDVPLLTKLQARAATD